VAPARAHFLTETFSSIYIHARLCAYTHARPCTCVCARGIYIKSRADITLVPGVSFHGDREISTRECNEMVTSLVVIDDGPNAGEREREEKKRGGMSFLQELSYRSLLCKSRRWENLWQKASRRAKWTTHFFSTFY